jgi:NADPH2:quinone reductase
MSAAPVVRETIRAAVYRAFGPAAAVLAIERRALPMPAAGEVRVRIAVSGVNPSDVKNRAGRVVSAMPFPEVIPHSDGAGVIDAVGAGVPTARVGERVWVWNAQFRRPFGTAAEAVCLPATQAVSLPAAASFAEGACVGIPVLTAWRAVTLGTDLRGATVLVSGGAGVVGHYAVQIAKLRGARVVATVGSEPNVAQAFAAGADAVVRHDQPDLAARVLEANAGRRVQRAIEVEFGLDAAWLPDVVEPEGEVYVFGSAARMEPTLAVQRYMMAGLTLHFRSVYLLPGEVRARAIVEVTDWLAQRRLVHRVAGRFPLERVADAHAAVEYRARPGAVLVDVAGLEAP